MSMTAKPQTQNMALFCDFENVARGVRDAKYAAFDNQKVLERLLLKGNIVVKQAIKCRKPGFSESYHGFRSSSARCSKRLWLASC
jgi:hypothetical protein